MRIAQHEGDLGRVRGTQEPDDGLRIVGLLKPGALWGVGPEVGPYRHFLSSGESPIKPAVGRADVFGVTQHFGDGEEGRVGRRVERRQRIGFFNAGRVVAEAFLQEDFIVFRTDIGRAACGSELGESE